MLDSVHSILLSGSSCRMRKRNTACLPIARSVLMLDSFQGRLSISALDAALANASMVIRRTINIFFIMLLSRKFEPRSNGKQLALNRRISGGVVYRAGAKLRGTARSV